MKKLLIATLFLAAGAMAAAQPDPVETVKSKFKDVSAIAGKATRTEQDVQKVKEILGELFDYQELGLRSLPKETLKSLDSTTKAKFLASFRAMLEMSSTKDLDSYKSRKFKYDPAVIEAGKDGTPETQVTAHVTIKGKESVLVYKMRLIDGRWRAWDLVIDDLSTSFNYRDQFKKILKDKPFSELQALVEAKSTGKAVAGLDDVDEAAKKKEGK